MEARWPGNYTTREQYCNRDVHTNGRWVDGASWDSLAMLLNVYFQMRHGYTLMRVYTTITFLKTYIIWNKQGTDFTGKKNEKMKIK